MNLVIKAIHFAEKAHRGQVRKYSDNAYIVHPIRMLYRLMDYGCQDPNVLCAALLHDTCEDCGISFENIEKEFNKQIADLVKELTQADKMGDESISKLPRTERHKLNVHKLLRVSQNAKLIKLVDRLDNLSEVDLTNNECYGFLKRRYIQESFDILNAVACGSSYFSEQLYNVIKDLAVKCKVVLK